MNQLLQHREPTQSELDMATEALLGARVMRPYYAVAIAPLKPLAVDGLGTIAVDPYWRLYIDFEWFSALSLEKRAYVITAHEIEHLLRRHHKRCDPRDHNLFNICGDCEINDDAEAFRQAVEDIGMLAPGAPVSTEAVAALRNVFRTVIINMEQLPDAGSVPCGTAPRKG